jgi:hypothetical protein
VQQKHSYNWKLKYQEEV